MFSTHTPYTPRPTSSATALPTTLSSGVPHKSTTLPPEYDSIPPSSSSAAAAFDPHAEKQALRDEQLRQGLPVSPEHYKRIFAHHHHQQQPQKEQEQDRGRKGDELDGRLEVSLGQTRTFVPASANTEDDPTMSPSPKLGHRGHLPKGMDVRDALAKCEDPTLGWSLRFWITISDPLTQHVFFACPATGQCSWDPPVGAFIVPRSPDGEWWELADATRGNRSYYYNTLTGKTQWTRPGGDAFVIPLGLIQRNALPARPKPTTHKSQSETPSRQTPTTPSRARSSTVDSTPTKSYPVPPRSPGSSSTLSPSSSFGPTSQTLQAIVLGQFASPTKNPSLVKTSTPSSNSIPTISEHEEVPPSLKATASSTNPSAEVSGLPSLVLEEGSGNETDRSDNSGGGWWERRKSTAMAVRKFASPSKKGHRVRSVYEEGIGLGGSPLKREHVKIGTPVPENFEAGGSSESNSSNEEPEINGNIPGALPTEIPSEPIFVEQTTPMRTKRLSTGLHPLLPPDISNEIQSFQGDDSARKYFATKRSGVLRQRVPVERIVEWQRTPISAPLLVLSRHLTRDAIVTFKVIQHVMGERDRPVEGAKPMQSSSSHLNLASLALGGRKGDEGHPSRGGKLANGFTASRSGLLDPQSANGVGAKSEKMIVLDEIRWTIQLCVSAGEMRDEVYCQLVKQLTKNPDHDAVVLGFQLFCVLVNAFGPSKNFEPFVKSVLQKHVHEKSDGVGVMARYCIAKMEVFMNKGLRAKALTIGEIEHASDAAFYPSIYGESLDRIMELQQRSYPSLLVPVILPFLADGILALGGMQSEGVFRVPGDGDSVSELKSRMDRGHYQLKGIDDPHVAASLFKLWLRELEDPIVPTKMYNEALIASKTPEEAIQFVKRLPTYNKRVLLFVISFVKLFMDDDVVKKTKMTPGNLALVMAPNILRTTSKSLVTVFTNSSFESKFILQLLEHMDPTKADPDYVPTHGQAVGRV